MGKEIERKFLVRGTDFIQMCTSAVRIRQGYLSANPDATVRVRRAGENAYLTVKSRNAGAVRDEWEYPVPTSEADEMLDKCCSSCISKTRYIVPFEGRTWEVDVFDGHLSGLIVAEVELESADSFVQLPPFVGREVTGDARYYNSSLADPSSPLPPSE